MMAAMTHMPHFNVNGTDRDGQNDNCDAGDSGFQVAPLWFPSFLVWIPEPSRSELQQLSLKITPSGSEWFGRFLHSKRI